MLGWLYRFLIGRFTSCKHEWETIQVVSLVREEGDVPHGHRYVLRCKKCGDLTRRRIV